MKPIKHSLASAAAGFAERRKPGMGTVLRRSLRVVSHSQIARMAAALSYRTVFGIIPVLAIGVAVLGGFASGDQVKQTIESVLDFTGLKDIAVDGPAEPAQPPAVPVVGPFDLDGAVGAGGLEPANPAKLEFWLNNLVSKVREVSFLAIGLTGLIMLIYAALSFMVEIERSANHIYRAPTGRSWVRRITQYWTTLTLGTIFLIGTFYAGETLTTWLKAVQAAVGVSTTLGPEAAGIAVSIAISFLLLLFLYMTIPNARVSVRCAAIGAGFAAVLWGAGKFGFVQVVKFSAYQRLYGALALIPLFLLWVYITWIIILFGLQLSYVLQYFRAFSVADDENRGPVIVDPLALLRVAAIVARRFAGGGTASVAQVATEVGLDERTSLLMLERLTDAGLLHHVPEGAETEAFALARPADQIQATDLLHLASLMTDRGDRNDRADRLETIRRAQFEAAAGLSLASLLPEDQAPPPPPDPKSHTGPDPIPAT